MTTVSLRDLKPGQSARVVELRSGDPARLDRLGAYGMVPGSLVWMQQSHPIYVVRIGGTELAVDGDVAGEILVTTDGG